MNILRYQKGTIFIVCEGYEAAFDMMFARRCACFQAPPKIDDRIDFAPTELPI